MKKSIKIISFIFILAISFLLFNSNVKAEDNMCAQAHNESECESIDKMIDAYECKYDETEGKCNKYVLGQKVGDSSSKECGDITNLEECANESARCTPIMEGVKLYKCVNKGEEKEAYALISKEKAPFKCSDVKYLTGAWTLIRIAAPFIIILFGSLDFIKAVMASDEKKMKESKGKFIKRLIAFILFIVLPFVVQFIFSNMGTYGSDNMCLVKCIVTNNTSEEECD